MRTDNAKKSIWDVVMQMSRKKSGQNRDSPRGCSVGMGHRMSFSN